MTSALRHTDSGVRPIVTAAFNVPAARLAKEQATNTTGSGTSGVYAGVTLFKQGFDELNKISSISDLRVYGETAFKCNLLGMSAQGTGPYRQILTEITHELHVPHLIPEELFIPNANSLSTDIKTINRHTIVPNPSSGSSKALAMFEYVGRLIGIAIRNHDKGYTMLPFFLTSTFWKQLSREKLNNTDFKGIDARMHKMLMEIEQCTYEEFDSIVDSIYHAKEEGEEEEEEEEEEKYVYFTTRLSCGRLIELLPGGAVMPLTYSNRHLYATLMRRARLAESRVQMSRIRLGISDIVPMSELFRLFTWKELENMVCGEDTIDVNLLKQNTTYSGEFELIRRTNSSSNSSSGETKESKSTTADSSSGGGEEEEVLLHPVVCWFWDILEEFDNENRSKFVKFASGRDRLSDEKDFSYVLFCLLFVCCLFVSILIFDCCYFFSFLS